MQALVWIESDAAPRMEAGMPAAIELEVAGGEAGTLDGTIAAIFAAPLPEELAAFASPAPMSIHRIDITLDEGLDLASLAGGECRIVIELGNHAPVAFFE